MAEPTKEIGKLIGERKLGGFQIWLMICCALVVLLDGYDIQTMSLVVPTLIGELEADRAAFGLTLSAALMGMLIGYAIIAPLGDKVGRKPVLIAGMALVGVASIATAYALELAPILEPVFRLLQPALSPLGFSDDANLFSFFVWRFITGMGLGASLPNATALTSEYVPDKSRAFLIGMMYLSVALGALTAGFVAPPILDALGWHWIFLIGGFIPLGICVLLAFSIPESLRLLVEQKPGDPRIPKLLARIAPGVDPASVYAERHDVKSQSVFALLAPRYFFRTVLLWLVFIFNLFVLYALIGWLPQILTEAGWTQAQALRGSVTIQAGGIIGGLIIARFIDRGMTVRAMAVGYILTVIAFALFLVLPPTVPNWITLLLVIGGGISGAQVSLNSLSVIFYPPLIRATGAGWANTMGRFGAIAAPIVAGALTAAFSLDPVQQLTLLVPPTLVCVIGIILLPLFWKQKEA